MHYSKAVSHAILMSDAFGCPTTDGIDNVGRAFDGTEAIPQNVPKGVDDTSIMFVEISVSSEKAIRLFMSGGPLSDNRLALRSYDGNEREFLSCFLVTLFRQVYASLWRD